MSVVHTESAAIFGGVTVNAAEDKVQFVEYRPSFAVDGKSVVEFVIPGNSAQYVSLRDSYVVATVRVAKQEHKGEDQVLADRKRRRRNVDGEPTKRRRREVETGEDDDGAGLSPDDLAKLKAEEEKEEEQEENAEGQEETETRSYAFPVDAIFHTMWNGVDVFMNQQLVSTTNTMYAYKAMIETMLNNSVDTKKYQLTSIGFTGNDGEQDNPDVQEAINIGQSNRWEMFRDGKSVQLLGYLASDMMTIEAAILPGVEIVIKLYPNRDKNRLMTFPIGTEAELVLEDIVLKVCKKTMTPDVVVSHANALEKGGPARYPFRRTEVRAFGVPAGYRTATIENPYQSNIPTRLIAGMVKTKSYAGDFQANPFNFKHFDVSGAGLYIDDEPIPKRPYKLAPSQGIYIEPLMDLYSLLGKAGEDRDIGVSREQYLNGMFLIPFDTCPTAAGDMAYLSRYQGGHMRLELTYSKALKEPIQIITYAIFPAILEIDAARNVTVRELEKPQARAQVKEVIGPTTAASA